MSTDRKRSASSPPPNIDASNILQSPSPFKRQYDIKSELATEQSFTVIPASPPSVEGGQSEDLESISSSRTNPSIIPCWVCTAPSTGLHYGAITCEGCKGFFKRAKKLEKTTFKCFSSGNCDIEVLAGPNTAKLRGSLMCKACRYDKCLKVGMTTFGKMYDCKRGRYKTSVEMGHQKGLLSSPSSAMTSQNSSNSENDMQYFSVSNVATSSVKPSIGNADCGSISPTDDDISHMISSTLAGYSSSMDSTLTGGINSRTDMSSIPCRVCAASSSGYHYGTITCEGCKGFFKRAIKLGDPNYHCGHSGNCDVTRLRRSTMCKFCRLKKCWQVGMSPYGSKRGRYSEVLRQETLLEVQKHTGLPSSPSSQNSGIFEKDLSSPASSSMNSSTDGQSDQGSGYSNEISNIPCQVCSAPSSGLHYGAVTCEGCKSFFKRAKKMGDPAYQCANSRYCNLTMLLGSVMCKACRLNKCLQVGMTTDRKKCSLSSSVGRKKGVVRRETLSKIHSHIEPQTRSSSQSLGISEKDASPLVKRLLFSTTNSSASPGVCNSQELEGQISTNGGHPMPLVCEPSPNIDASISPSPFPIKLEACIESESESAYTMFRVPEPGVEVDHSGGDSRLEQCEENIPNYTSLSAEGTETIDYTNVVVKLEQPDMSESQEENWEGSESIDYSNIVVKLEHPEMLVNVERSEEDYTDGVNDQSAMLKDMEESEKNYDTDAVVKQQDMLANVEGSEVNQYANADIIGKQLNMSVNMEGPEENDYANVVVKLEQPDTCMLESQEENLEGLESNCSDSYSVKLEPLDTDLSEAQTDNMEAEAQTEKMEAEAQTENMEDSDDEIATTDVDFGQVYELCEKLTTQTSGVKCQVCETESAICHDGVQICFMCKDFFFRSMQKVRIDYECSSRNQCALKRSAGPLCQYCQFRRCLQLGLASPIEPDTSTESAVEITHCRVCNAISSGIHFGTPTCEGCFCFFKRMRKMENPHSYVCQGSGSCDMIPGSPMCKACRYKKCLQVGMSTRGIKMGRRSNSFKKHGKSRLPDSII